MAEGDKINLHPDKAEIIRRLTEGDTVKSVERWLEKKYSSSSKKKFRISYMTLRNYSQDILGLKGDLLKQIRENRDVQLTVQEEHKDVYCEAEAVADSEVTTLLDENARGTATELIARQIINMGEELKLIRDKIWERVKVIEGEKYRASSEQVLCNLLAQARTLVSDYFKMLESQESKGTQISINMRQVEQQQIILKQCIQETLQEICPEAIPLFLEKLRIKLEQAEHKLGTQTSPSVNINIKA